jgi:carboxylesterase type B
LQSGTLDAPVQSHVVSIKDQNNKWEKVKEFTKAKNVEELRRVPAMDFMGAWFATEEGKHTAAVPEWTLDGAWLKDDWVNTISSRNLQVIMGDVEAERSLFAAVLQVKPVSDDGPINVTTAWNQIETSLPTQAATILRAYGAESSSSVGQLISATLEIIGDLSFRRASDVEAQRLIKEGIRLYRYVFDEESPFPLSPFHGQAAHSLDLNYSFGSRRIFSGRAGVEHPEWEYKIQQSMQEKWIAFANGEIPWRAQSEDRYYAFGPEGFDGEIDKEEFQKRRRTKRWAAFEGLSREELISFGIACNKAYAELSGHHLYMLGTG